MRIHAACFVLAGFLTSLVVGQDQLPSMPRYDRYEKMRREIGGAVKRGEVRPRWSSDGKSFVYTWDSKTYTFDLATLKATEGDNGGASTPAQSGGRRRGGVERGRQFGEALSPDGTRRAFFRDQNVWLSDKDGKNEVQLTTDGDKAKRIKYGQASWVYGEELGVREAMWFSPNGRGLAFYRFDESKVLDYYLTLNQGAIQSTLDVEAYPKAGTPNPEVSLLVYDFETRATVRVDTSFGEAALGHYVYEVRWSPDGKELFFNRTDRKQRTMQFCAANPATGACRVIVEEQQPNSWTENAPAIRWFADNRRFLWVSERNGFRNFYLGSLDGAPLKAVTQHPFEVADLIRLDEKAGVLWYRARSGANPYLLQLHRVNLDGSNDQRLTDPNLSHDVSLSPDGKYFTDIAEAYDVAPTTTLRDASGKQLAVLAESDLTKFHALGLRKAERITFTAADGSTTCYGYLEFPSDFDPSKKYPLVVGMYAGPESGTNAERFQTPDPMCEFGFITAWFDGRGTAGRGKAFKDAVYGKLGIVEIDDQAAGVKELAKRPYIDSTRVGVHGTSYGGYASLMCLLRYPDTFHVAVSSASVTQWANYDTIYTERYMGLPWEGENKEGYAAGSAMTYARSLKGKLLLFYGTADNNVHPSNSLQLAQALMRAGKSFDMLVGTDMGHAGINSARMWEYFIDHLIVRPSRKDSLASLYRAWRAKALD